MTFTRNLPHTAYLRIFRNLHHPEEGQRGSFDLHLGSCNAVLSQEDAYALADYINQGRFTSTSGDVSRGA